MVVARLQKVSVYAAGFLVAFRRRVWGDLKKVHPPRNQIYRVVENVPLNVLECHVSMVNSVVQNSGNTTIRTVVLGDQHSIDELLSLQEFDPLAFGSCRLVPAGEVCGVTPPLMIRHYQECCGATRVRFTFCKATVKLDSTVSIDRASIPSSREQWGQQPQEEFALKRDLVAYKKSLITAPALLMRILTLTAALQLFEHIVDYETELTKGNMENKLSDYKRQFSVRE
jgi:hypothetical protein